MAFAYHRLTAFATRITRAGLRGVVVLRAGDSVDGCPWPVLTAENGSQAVIEEYFLDEDISDLADILAFLDEGRHRDELRFHLEDLLSSLLLRLRRELEHAGVPLPDFGPVIEGSP